MALGGTVLQLRELLPHSAEDSGSNLTLGPVCMDFACPPRECVNVL